jgi:hypothetical protein
MAVESYPQASFLERFGIPSDMLHVPQFVPGRTFLCFIRKNRLQRLTGLRWQLSIQENSVVPRELAWSFAPKARRFFQRSISPL